MGTMFRIKQGDTRPVLVATLTKTVNEVTSAIDDLGSALWVKFLFRRDGVTIERTATVESPAADGVISYTFVAADWDVLAVGSYQIEIRIAYGAADFLTVPTDGYGRLVVLDGLV